MDLKHTNTSRWAKMALQHGHNAKELRQAYHESVQLGNDLLKKAREVEQSQNDGEDGAAAGLAELTALAEQGSAGTSAEVTGRYRKLFDSTYYFHEVARSPLSLSLVVT
jgi:U3 small nucleolar RNA-associated protein 14